MPTVAIKETVSYDLPVLNASLDSLFSSLGMDPRNPFEQMILPGMNVFIKPNWVASHWRESCSHQGDIYSVITHPALIEAVARRVLIALGGKGSLTIGDNPSIDADFTELMLLTGIKKLEEEFPGLVRVVDLRPLVCTDLAYYGQKSKMHSQSGDPLGETQINLGKKSLFYGMDPALFRGVFNEREETIAAHSGENHLYTMANSIYKSDVFISLPKLKTHHKTGVTLNLKGLVGTVTQKNQLIHWRVGYPEIGGDEYPDKETYERMEKEKIQERGAWIGNDTIWRMVADLYTVLNTRQRKYFTIIDGILGGEGQGPFCPDSKNGKTLIASSDFLSADVVAARYMGMDPEKIVYLSHLMKHRNLNGDHIAVIKDGSLLSGFFTSLDPYLDFKVKPYWQGIKIQGRK